MLMVTFLVKEKSPTSMLVDVVPIVCFARSANTFSAANDEEEAGAAAAGLTAAATAGTARW